MSTFTDATICLDGWTDASGNSIYRFMILKEHQKHIIDIMSSSIACVTDNLSIMVLMKNLLKEQYLNIVPIRCCLHAFNLIVKDIAGFTGTVSVCKNNQKLVNFFTASHIWLRVLKNWQKEEGISHFLTTFCKTQWYSLAKVCLGVSTFERGFQHCLKLSETNKTKYPKIKDEIKSIVNDRYHFASNDTLVKVIKPVIDAIGRLESREATLADVFKELIYIHLEISRLDIPIIGFKTHALIIISKRAREFSEDIYFIALFLSPIYKNIAVSRHMNSDHLLRECLKLAKAWNFSKNDANILYKKLINYKNNDPLFNLLLSDIQKSPQLF
ncbi:10884_t:CDS:2 [Cetraspora pellucida]|uniref:10884_t:CDS:1 n=1 Tax=Cetraspora pellucida TaxID=1433469 RepID=A0ACA9PQY0_9GLOM|nr:10884_t:CDS:2 [Cetraspora pellucida]